MLKSHDRPVHEVRKEAPAKRTPFVRARVYRGSTGTWHTYLNAGYPEREGDPQRAVCEKCGFAYAELIHARTCVCSECRSDEIVAWALHVQEIYGVELGWTLNNTDVLCDEVSQSKAHYRRRKDHTRAADLSHVKARA